MYSLILQSPLQGVSSSSPGRGLYLTVTDHGGEIQVAFCRCPHFLSPSFSSPRLEEGRKMKYKSQDITYLTGQHTVGTDSSLRPTLSLMGTVVGSMELLWQGQVNCSQLIALHPPHIPQTTFVVPNMLDSYCLCCSPPAKAEHEMGLCWLSLLCAHSWLHPLTSQTLRMQISQNTGTSVLHSLL